MLALGIPVALALQQLCPLTSKRSSRLLASACLLGLIIGIGLAFVPPGVTQLAAPGQAQTTDNAATTTVALNGRLVILVEDEDAVRATSTDVLTQ